MTGIFLHRLGAFVILVWLSVGLAACSGFIKGGDNRHNQPLSSGVVQGLRSIGSSPADGMVIRIFKEESVLEVWKKTSSGTFRLFNRGFAARETDTEWTFSRNLSQATAGLRRTQGGAAARLTSTVNHYLVKSFGRRWREAEDLLAGLFYAAAEPTAASTAVRRDPRTAPPLSMFERAANVDMISGRWFFTTICP